jgi:hypothetical protein
MDFKRRKHEQSVAADIAEELFRALGPGIPIADHGETACRVFGPGWIGITSPPRPQPRGSCITSRRNSST